MALVSNTTTLDALMEKMESILGPDAKSASVDGTRTITNASQAADKAKPVATRTRETPVLGASTALPVDKSEAQVPTKASRADMWRGAQAKQAPAPRSNTKTPIARPAVAQQPAANRRPFSPAAPSNGKIAVLYVSSLPAAPADNQGLRITSLAQSLGRQGYQVAVVADSATPVYKLNAQLMSHLEAVATDTTGRTLISVRNPKDTRSTAIAKALGPRNRDVATVIVGYPAPETIVDDIRRVVGLKPTIVAETSPLDTRLHDVLAHRVDPLTGARSFGNPDINAQVLIRFDAAMVTSAQTRKAIESDVLPIAASRAAMPDLRPLVPGTKANIFEVPLVRRQAQVADPAQLPESLEDGVDAALLKAIGGEAALSRATRRDLYVQEAEIAQGLEGIDAVEAYANGEISHDASPVVAPAPAGIGY